MISDLKMAQIGLAVLVGYRICLAILMLYVVAMYVQIIMIYWRLSFPRIIGHLMLALLAYVLTICYTLADLIDSHLFSGINWRTPIVMILVVLGVITVRLTREYFLNAEIGDPDQVKVHALTKTAVKGIDDHE